jgi:phosphate transport system substrate-binding protein
MKKQDTVYNDWNSGKITISTDESVSNITAQLKQIYEHENSNAQILLKYQPQDKIISQFINGEISSMIISRALTEKEKESSQQHQQVEIIENIFAYTAVAVIANAAVKDTAFDVRKIKDYLQPNSSIRLVFDNEQSGIPSFIASKASIGSTSFKNALVVKNTEAVIEYVQLNSNAIGFIPYNLISEENGERAKILSRVKLLAVTNGGAVYIPSQESIYNFTYPLQCPINLVLGRNPELIGKGFSNFLCRVKASKILLRAGLVPRYMPVRRIVVHNELQTN